jgi:hypothetical protein
LASYTLEEIVSAGRLVRTGFGAELRQIEFRAALATEKSADVMEAEFDRWNRRYDIPSVDKAVGRRPECSVVRGDEVRPPDARRAEDEDLSRVKIFFLSCSVHRHKCDGRAETVTYHEQPAVLFDAPFYGCPDLRPDDIGRSLKSFV